MDSYRDFFMTRILPCLNAALLGYWLGVGCTIIEQPQCPTPTTELGNGLTVTVTGGGGAGSDIPQFSQE